MEKRGSPADDAVRLHRVVRRHPVHVLRTLLPHHRLRLLVLQFNSFKVSYFNLKEVQKSPNKYGSLWSLGNKFQI